MTLGRTASNAIKIKTDGGTTRAVECACCGGCPDCEIPPPPGKWKITASSLGPITYQSPYDPCGSAVATAGGWTLSIVWQCYAGFWTAFGINLNEPYWACQYIVGFPNSPDPSGTVSIIGCTADDPQCTCFDYTFTVEPDND